MADRKQEIQAATTSALAWTIPAGFNDPNEIKLLTLKLATAPTTAGLITISIDSQAGATYDTSILKINPVGKTDIVVKNLGKLVGKEMTVASVPDKILVSYTNADGVSITGTANFEKEPSGGPTEVLLDGEVQVTESGSYDSTTGATSMAEIDPLDMHFTNQVVDVDLADVAAATHYYPGATGFPMDGFKDLSMSGKFIDADGTLTLTAEAMNDEDTASGDWVQVYFYDDKNNATVNNLTVTNGTLTFAISLNEANFQHFRFKVVASGATNTVVLKGRRKAL